MLITGGAGFIGSHFIHHMLKQNDELQIINIDALTYAGSLNNLKNLPDPKRHHFVHSDICHIESIQKLFDQYPIDTIVHFAAESHVDRSISGPGAFVVTNVVGTFNLLETARQFWLCDQKLNETQCRFHHISTDEVFGALTKDEDAFVETSPHKPNSPYSASKASSDHLVDCYYHTYGLPITMSHCSNNYGPMQHSEKFIPTIVHACLNEQPIPIYGKGDQIRDWLYVEDHCRAIEYILKKGKVGAHYNIGGSNEQVNLDVAKQVCRILDLLVPRKKPYETLIRFIPDRLGHDWRYAINSSKIQNELGWKSLESFETGLVKTVQAHVNM